jgi:hypothetical protein
MNKLLLIFRNACIGLALFLFFSCGETIPTIIFTTPQKNQEYFKDKDIDIKVILADTKGKAFTVQLYVDDTLFGELSNTPYYFTVKAGEVPPGKHILKIMTDGAEATLPITIKDIKSESDDFVTFTDGIIPPEWSVKNWTISNLDGVDDKFSLTAMTPQAQVSTTKTCNKISFYMKGTGNIEFYMDKTPLDTIQMRAGIILNPEQTWTLYEFECPKRYHTFTWKLIENNMLQFVYLDAIRFENID